MKNSLLAKTHINLLRTIDCLKETTSDVSSDHLVSSFEKSKAIYDKQWTSSKRDKDSLQCETLIP